MARTVVEGFEARSDGGGERVAAVVVVAHDHPGDGDVGDAVAGGGVVRRARSGTLRTRSVLL